MNTPEAVRRARVGPPHLRGFSQCPVQLAQEERLLLVILWTRGANLFPLSAMTAFCRSQIYTDHLFTNIGKCCMSAMPTPDGCCTLFAPETLPCQKFVRKVCGGKARRVLRSILKAWGSRHTRFHTQLSEANASFPFVLTLIEACAEKV